MAHQPTWGFMKLPAELRLHVYSYMCDPVEVATQDYEGLYRTCRQVKEEMDIEGVKPMVQHINAVVQEWDEAFPGYPLRVAYPIMFGQLKHLRIDIQESLFLTTRTYPYGEFQKLNWEPQIYRDVVELLRPLAKLYLCTFTVKTNDTNAVVRDETSIRYAIYLFSNLLYYGGLSTRLEHTVRLVVDLGMSTQTFTTTTLRIWTHGFYHNNIILYWVDAPGSVGGSFRAGIDFREGLPKPGPNAQCIHHTNKSKIGDWDSK
ncbi:hypothetical protein BDV96DRAFT_647979 [Lophiotrema nucula]|uniref:Uncharacterized protein n=1 Tax=Lophiotrema nucula TaxID=690887 RepID=A0A6A5Z3Z6_9PLEO|nr:hypothetical protein BDV96DRAFT_647979 [Lophiotrema nucula]